MRIVLLGAPGCGKGTQGQRLASHYKIPEISAGDLLREAVAAGTPLGKAAKAVMDAGQLVSDEIVLGVLRERLGQVDVRKGFILDGFPRNLTQAEQLDELLEQLGQPIDLALLVKVDVDMILQRLLGRRSCLSCGASYNIFSAPPRMDDSCDACGGRLKRRADDNEETIGNRLRIYETQTLPVIERYREQGRLREIQGVGYIDDVFKAVSKAIEEARPSFGKDRSAAIRRAVARKMAQQGGAVSVSQGKGSPAVTAASRKPSSPSPDSAATADSSVTGGGEIPDKPAVKKKTAKKAVVKKKAGTKKKVVAKKKAAKKTPVKKKAGAKKKVVSKKKVAKKTSLKKKSATKKKAVKKKASIKKKAGTKKKVVAKKQAAKKTSVKKKAGAKKKVVSRKKAAHKKKAAVKKKTAKKAPVRKKQTTKKKTQARKKAGKKRR